MSDASNPAPGADPEASPGDGHGSPLRRRLTDGAGTVLVLHPGAMGARMAGECQGAGRVVWVSDGRSEATVARADAEGLEAVPTLADGLAGADLVVSICPPDAALATAEKVARVGADAGFGGLYLDANAISPATASAVAERVGVDRFVDGGVIGPPPGRPGSTRLYLSAGPDRRWAAEAVAGLWSGSTLEAVVIDGGVGAASALKMAYAAWTKGSAALLLTIVAGAEAFGVRADLEAEWSRSQPGLAERAGATATGVGPKAWRFAGEMEEIAATFAGADLPDGFWSAAADTYRRLAPLRNEGSPGLERAVELLARP